jgi:hypothetical protein
MRNSNGRVLPYFSLFASTGTLLCCALPSLLVAIGAGATLASLATNFPLLVTLSEKKVWVFLVAGLLLSFAGFLQWKAKDAPCPIDPDLAKACDRSRKLSLALYFISVGIFAIGGVFAFVLPRITFLFQ